jgi:hypothetical protein
LGESSGILAFKRNAVRDNRHSLFGKSPPFSNPQPLAYLMPPFQLAAVYAGSGGVSRIAGGCSHDVVR